MESQQLIGFFLKNKFKSQTQIGLLSEKEYKYFQVEFKESNDIVITLARLKYIYIQSNMSLQVSISNKIIKDLSTDTSTMVQAFDKKGVKYYAKLINIQKSQQLGFDECIEFNKEVFSDIEDYIFKENILQIYSEVSNSELLGLITDVYECNLQQYIDKAHISEKDALDIFSQVVKAIYSLVMNGYWHRNIRPDHFVRVDKVWKLESAILSEDFNRANGNSNEYIWNPKYQPPEFKINQEYSDEQYQQMNVWNLGCILLNLLIGVHKLTNKQMTDKFKGSPFTMQAIGIKQVISSKFTVNIKELLASLLHHNPTKRMKLNDLFLNKSISAEVAKHFFQNKQLIPNSKMIVGKTMRGSSLNYSSKQSMKQLSNTLQQKQAERRKMLQSSIINDVVEQDDFIGTLIEFSTKIHSKQLQFTEENNQSIESIMTNKDHPLRKALQLYKSYYDETELLMISSQVIDKQLKFVMFIDEGDIKQIKFLNKYAITFVSLINLHILAEGFNQNRNIYDLDGDLFTAFQNSSQYSSFQKFINFKRTERDELLENLKREITMTKNKNIIKNNLKISDLLNRNYKNTTFNDIKVAYRCIVKYSYDSITQQYNKTKISEQESILAKTGMYVTYCLTIDKLYLKEEIPYNFKFYFKWINKPPSNYVPLTEFKKFIENAPKDILIQNSRFILKRYYNL